MEQEAVFDVGEFDERTVSLDETPRDAIHYLQQVAVSRARCPQIVTAKFVPRKSVSSSIWQKFEFKVGAPSESSVRIVSFKAVNF
ncbi:unnamed protein product [Gongylonema pulchrum]|uniref:BSD domain-containing protein n=1 Tax=Gongylonema pulchrum TaxID=637853 RepID=A0A183DCG4_9BILA|nr:unnamed protein product [Gongylonema pulchrum]